MRPLAPSLSGRDVLGVALWPFLPLPLGLGLLLAWSLLKSHLGDMTRRWPGRPRRKSLSRSMAVAKACSFCQPFPAQKWDRSNPASQRCPKNSFGDTLILS